MMIDVGGAQLACHHHVSDPDNLTLVHFHGNGEVVADYVPGMVDELTRLGLNSLFVEYREYGDSTGTAQLVAMLGDGQRVLEAVGLQPGEVIVFGRSIGSLYAIELAHRHPDIGGMILESGIAAPGERFLAYADLRAAGIDEAEVMAEVKRHFDHRTKLWGYRQPLLIMHCEQDDLVDISHAERNHKWARGYKLLRRFRDGNHNSIMMANYAEYFQSIKSFAKLVAAEPN
ncbi:MAG: alpha/beta hydrolase [Pirellulaceae bacterium]|jgi:hypothetical protein|nr:alpha/beta hydrolase [Pirellulaceae bacterium]